jgi:hypothetical protein
VFANVNPPRLPRRDRFGLLAAAGLLAAWYAVVQSLLDKQRLFGVLGCDYGVLWAASRAVAMGNPIAAYDLDALKTYSAPLAAFSSDATEIHVLPSPYPPVFFLALSPLTALEPPASLIVWSLVNLVLTVLVVWQLATRYSRRPLAATVIVTAFLFPLAHTLLLGQVTGLMLFALYRAYRGLEEGREFRAGLWIGTMLVKPQYALVLILVLLFKRRWSALTGVAAVGSLLMATTVAVLGLDGVGAYVASLRSVSGFRAVTPGIHPEYMISWRGLLVNVLPQGVTEAQGLALTLVLSIASLALIPVLWRGAWDPGDSRFAARMLATMVITMLVSFHNHAYGALLLLVPALGLAWRPASRRLLHRVLQAALFTPPIVFFTTGSLVTVGLELLALMLIGLMAICAEEQVWACPPVPRAIAWATRPVTRAVARG